MHKLAVNGNVNHLPLRPINSNINTPTNNLGKVLSNHCHHYVNQIIMLEVPKALFKILNRRV